MANRNALIPNGTGQAVREDIELTFQAVKGNNSTGTTPTGNFLTSYMSWANTGDNQYMIHNGSSFHPLMDISQVSGFQGTHIAVPGSSSNPGYRFLNSSGTATQTGMGLPADDRIGFFHGSTERMSILNNGNVGIGTTAPTNGLHVNENDVTIQRSTSTDTILNIMNTASDSSGSAYIDLSADQTHTDFGLRVIRNNGENGSSALQHQGTGSLIFQCETTGSIDFVTNKSNTTTTNHKRWEISGEASIEGSFISNNNTISNALTNAGAAFHINGDAFEGLSLVKNNYGWGSPLFIQLLNASGSRNLLEFKYNTGSSGTGTAVGFITTNGTSTAYGTSSDYRLKENVVAISDGITRLKTLKPYRFNFISDKDTTVDGFFAHEVTAVPEAVIGTKDETDSDNNPKYQAIDQSKIVPLLVAALQEAVAKIETLEAKVAVLEGN